MPIFLCSNPSCRVVDHTALLHYWLGYAPGQAGPGAPLCSECDPRITLRWRLAVRPLQPVPSMGLDVANQRRGQHAQRD